MNTEDHRNTALVPPHGSRLPSPDIAWKGVQTLVFYDQPLMIAMGTSDEPYLGFAGADHIEKQTTYFVIPFSADGIQAFLAGDLTVVAAIELAGGDVYYSEDLKSFRRVALADIPEDDRVVLPQSGPDYESIWERRPEFA
jgi:hypothetical protein